MDEGIKEIEYAVFYARVSTKKEEQEESLENQNSLKEIYLKSHPNIKCIAEYSEQVSGKSDLRPEYQKMIERAKDPLVKYIMVKDTKRLYRSSAVAYEFKETLKKYGLKLILLSTGQISDPNANDIGTQMMFGIESVLNEEVVQRQSNYGRVTHQLKCERKILNRNNITFGYAWDDVNKEIYINEEEARIIRKMFDLYVFQGYGAKALEKYFEMKGYPRSAQTIRKYLEETAYIGIFHLNKKSSVLGIGKGAKTKRFTNPKEEWVPVERPELAIVDEEIFELAQRMRESKRGLYKQGENVPRQVWFSGTHIFSGKLFCGMCSRSYIHKIKENYGKHISVYVHRVHRKKEITEERCLNPYRTVYEEDLIDITRRSINGLIQKNQDCFSLILPAIQKAMQEDDGVEKEKADIRKRIRKEEKNKSKLLEVYMKAEGEMKDDINVQYNEKAKQIKELKKELEKYDNVRIKQEEMQDKLMAIRERIQQLKGTGVVNVDRRVADIFISQIILYGNGVMDFRLNNLDEREKLLPEVLEKIGQREITKPENILLEPVNDVINIGGEMKKSQLDIMPMFRFSVNYQNGKQTRKSIKRSFNIVVNLAVSVSIEPYN